MKPTHVSGNTLGTALMEALGLDGQPIVNINIDASVGDVAAVTITRLITIAEGESLARIMRTYELIESDRIDGQVIE